MFLPFKLRGLELVNRVVVSPMAQYCAEDGVPTDWHLVHYGHRALGGAGLVYTEMTCVSPEGRITPGCTGLWNATQRDAWQRIVDFVHANSPAKICLQLGHAGRKGSTQVGWEKMDHPLPEGNWPILAPSPLPYYEGISQVPVEMTRADMDDGARGVCARHPLRAAGGLRHARAAHGAWLPAGLLPLAAHQPSHRRVRRQLLKTGCGFRWKCLKRLGRNGRSTSRCRCVSRRPTGRRAGCPRRTC